jgi:hypothetical protein
VTALITIRMAGSVVQICDAKCYGAKHDDCECVCESENHGKGIELAIANTRRLHPDWIAAAGEDAEVELDDIVFQPPLFTIGDPMYVALTDRDGTRLTLWPSPDPAETFVFLAAGDRTAKLDADQARQVRDGLTDWLVEIGAETP